MNVKNNYKELPNLPGVYLFKAHDNSILYIGKAKSLRARVRSYFNKQTTNQKIQELISAYQTVEHIVTKNEDEALLLEANLIQQYQPLFNRLLKEGQPLLYILFTKRTPTEVKLVRTKRDKGIYFGPFLNKRSARATFHFLRKTFNLHTCNKKIEHGCLRYHIGTCAGTCKSNFDEHAYKIRVELAKNALRQHKQTFIKKLNDQIASHNAAFEFEKSKNLMKYKNDVDYIFKTLRLHFNPTKFVQDVTHVTLSKTERSPIAKHDIKYALQTLFKTEKPISTIDCFDISHFQSTSLVGSCVRFNNGYADKKKFRHFNIKTLKQQNDYAALHEIVQRRYKNSDYPDLIIIDGGKGQLNAIKHLIPTHIKCASLAKREERIFCDLYPNGRILNQKNDDERLLLELRDYAHHFAITFHRLKRSKHYFTQ